MARLALPIVGESESVSGLDIDADMLAVARSAMPEGMEVDCREASAEAMPFPDESFGVVLCQMGLQLMADKQAALGEMRLVLALQVPAPVEFLWQYVYGTPLARVAAQVEVVDRAAVRLHLRVHE